MHITTSIQLIIITDVMTTSGISSATVGTITLFMVDMVGTELEGVASTLLTVDVVKCVLDSERCVSISGTLLTGGVTTDDCDDGMSAEYHSGAVYGYHCVVRITAHTILIGANSTSTSTCKCDIDE